ncbi:RNA polymerase sigma-70 factor, ECF subfamily [Catalinimonas alkaloidigena]|uniref:RNA polymerase sigma-70 factor, ECF subfamily n=1 Tax=Catalinimonas alkaloidigena TaxID=1075417 RepID=A0A1G9QF22_9BACT|nr:sigma-70 family RNA polymerase sigma factor [Catalinimonas alkaloidigena]SDM09609.1 RNA polymerase sigma-70 factor, ECF subfamily [Catalinimonas alkaloidigena]
MMLKGTTSPSDSQLWQALHQGDELAFTTLFRRYYEELLNYGLRLVSEEDLVADCVQEAFADVWYYRASLNPQVQSIRFYMMRIVRRKLFKQTSRRDVQLNVVPAEGERSVEQRLVESEALHQRHTALQRSIDDLPSRQREALYLRYYDQMSFEEISDLMGVSVQSVRNFLHKALVRLRKHPSLLRSLAIGMSGFVFCFLPF